MPRFDEVFNISTWQTSVPPSNAFRIIGSKSDASSQGCWLSKSAWQFLDLGICIGSILYCDIIWNNFNCIGSEISVILFLNALTVDALSQ